MSLDTSSLPRNVIPLDTARVRIKNRVRKELVALGSEDQMMAYMQQVMPSYREDLRLEKAQVFFFYDDVQGLYIAYLTARAPGFPLTAKGLCRRSCLVALAEWFCDLPKLEKGKGPSLLPIGGITPRVVSPMPEFAQGR